MYRFARYSRFLHRWVGLFLALFLIGMGISGGLLNHPELINKTDVQGWLVSPSYRIENWNRGALIKVVSHSGQGDLLFACGRHGVFRSTDGSATFEPFFEGLPEAQRNRFTSDLFWSHGTNTLWAATRGGLFISRPAGDSFRKVPLAGPPYPFVKIVETPTTIFLVTDSSVFAQARDSGKYRRVPLEIVVNLQHRRGPSAIRAFLDLHGGEAWGLVGSFAGPFVERPGGSAADLSTGVPVQGRKPGRPGKALVTGYLQIPGHESLIDASGRVCYRRMVPHRKITTNHR